MADIVNIDYRHMCQQQGMKIEHTILTKFENNGYYLLHLVNVLTLPIT